MHGAIHRDGTAHYRSLQTHPHGVGCKNSHITYSLCLRSLGQQPPVTLPADRDRQTDITPTMPSEWILRASRAGNERLDSYKML